MGLPQELVDQIMDVLYDDIPVLKACSLTCKAMYASTRHLIHRTLQLSPETTLRVLTRGEERRYRRGNRDVEFRFLSFMGERGLLQYTRQVHICTQDPFDPENLLSHLHYFQSLRQVHTLTIDHFQYPEKCLNYQTTCFAHFYPTLTSLALSHSCGGRGLLNFALRFPNLENLSLEWLEFERGPGPQLIDAATSPERFPPLRGCLRLVSSQRYVPDDLGVKLFLKPPKGFNFRSLELEDIPSGAAQEALNACAQTLEDLTITNYRYSTLRLPFLPLDMAGDL